MTKSEIPKQSSDVIEKTIESINNFSFAENDVLDSFECSTGACPTK